MPSSSDSPAVKRAHLATAHVRTTLPSRDGRPSQPSWTRGSRRPLSPPVHSAHHSWRSALSAHNSPHAAPVARQHTAVTTPNAKHRLPDRQLTLLTSSVHCPDPKSMDIANGLEAPALPRLPVPPTATACRRPSWNVHT
ncbi:hypothetical protein B0T18DRAFT_165993 [Schizothecium vesticola]|uniref:Uncharacterized protein n=1 Tax=Schizothecium vesticola TaxID=314040 RepID=A0AA40EXC7_9PEZI|nr:hypothetical protein B0T18DRAFT_165993 [Schizothecium vesticola]